MLINSSTAITGVFLCGLTFVVFVLLEAWYRTVGGRHKAVGDASRPQETPQWILEARLAQGFRPILVEKPGKEVPAGQASLASTAVKPMKPLGQVLKEAQEAYDYVRDAYAEKCQDLDWQLNHPDLFRVTFEPSAAFFTQFEETKAWASRAQGKPQVASVVEAFAKAAEASVDLWEFAVGAAEKDSLSSLERGKLSRARKLVDQARDGATEEAHAVNLMAAAARILADLNLMHMEAQAKLALSSMTTKALALDARMEHKVLGS